MNLTKKMVASMFIFVLHVCLSNFAFAQVKPEVLTNEDLKRIVPTSFYFAGQSAETQLRNSAAAKMSENHFVIAGLVDTSGYSTEIQGKYEGFFITDAPVKIGGKTLKTGAYGFGFTENAIRIFDLSSREILTIRALKDLELKRPRPLMMIVEANGVRLYKGKTFVLISTK